MLYLNHKGNFLSFIKDKPKDLLDILLYLKHILNIGSKQHSIPEKCNDFRICINQFQHEWQIKLIYNIRPFGPVKATRCMSCDLECPLIIGLLGDDSDDHNDTVNEDLNYHLKDDKHHQLYLTKAKDSFIASTKFSRCFLDAKARSKLIVTPIRHVRSLFDLNDNEILDLFQAGSLCLNNLNFKNFNYIVLNHGVNQNHAHLHMKITVKPYCVNDEIDFNRNHDWFGQWLLKQTEFPEYYKKFTKINDFVNKLDLLK